MESYFKNPQACKIRVADCAKNLKKAGSRKKILDLRSFLMGATKTETKPSYVFVFVFCRTLWVCIIRNRNTGSVTYKTELEFRKMSRICKIDLQTYDWSVLFAMFQVCSSPRYSDDERFIATPSLFPSV